MASQSVFRDAELFRDLFIFQPFKQQIQNFFFSVRETVGLPKPRYGFSRRSVLLFTILEEPDGQVILQAVQKENFFI